MKETIEDVIALTALLGMRNKICVQTVCGWWSFQN